ncbi:flagellar basal-body MS-ring/collar protein FliF [Saccharophagus degradans]|uniref:Flagellar M-ring protein n=1 Tax=Saccharophagus degradans TaxID=86304 RepID=A0AAW7X2X4_9GAMM|nr:flagellar basal-body MS-ring/collar protein FliF [Saccharophagus degradans]MDO6421001.1 flagellar basal-body MS-ring/collar protein FliF [Saccharophagus degradans]MDO6606088.1 flagellar basal-body MS-ring/collar protein FliF [Saccharophagus degradans]
MAQAPAHTSTNDLIDGFNNLNIIRQAGLMVGLAASVAIGFAVVLWSQGEDYKPLYGSLDRLDSSEVGAILDFNEIPYKIDGSTGALLVAVDEVHRARLVLAENGIQGDNSTGYELLDQEQPLGTSQFMEATRYKRGIEGELARTIASINSVRGARVHLAIPKRSVFVGDGRKPSASVFLDLYPGRPIKPKQIQGIANLVASSIPELQVEDVTVVDQKGNLLTTGIAEDKDLLIAGQHLEYTQKVEDGMIMRVRRLLSPILGDQNFKTEVAADIDFTEIEQAEEVFNPDLPAVRSEQTVEEQRIGSGAPGGIPGALTNQPPADGQAPEQAGPGGEGAGGQPSNTRSQAVRNYELDRTVSYTKREKGRLRRLTVAVVIDDKKTINPETGAVERTQWTQQELERFAILVRDAVGYSAVRGDSVNILNEAFLPEPAIEVLDDLPFWQNESILKLIKPIAGALIIVALLVGLVRPVLKSLAVAGVKTREQDEAKEMAALQAAGMDGFDSLSDETVTLTGGDALALPSPEEGYEQQLNAVKGLVAEDAGRVAQVIKRWINEE